MANKSKLSQKVFKFWDSFKEIFHPVKKVPLSDLLTDDFILNSNLTHAIVTETPKGDRIVKTCSANYGLMSNKDLLEPLISNLHDKYTLEAKVRHTNYSKFYIDLIIKDTVFKVLKKDDIFCRLRINNSYDGSVKYQMNFGFYRLVCDNGLSVPLKGLDIKAIKLRHTLNNYEKGIKATLDLVDKFLKFTPDIVKLYDEMAKSKITLAEALTLIEETTEKTKYPKKLQELAANRLNEESKQFPISKFLVYNAMNHALYNNETAMKIHKRDKVDEAVLNYINS